jgi:predicted MPP superfamily phosphohydrolase
MKQVNGSVVYVSSGLGTWGPPVRLGNRPEIVVLTLSSAFDEGYR